MKNRIIQLCLDLTTTVQKVSWFLFLFAFQKGKKGNVWGSNVLAVCRVLIGRQIRKWELTGNFEGPWRSVSVVHFSEFHPHRPPLISNFAIAVCILSGCGLKATQENKSFKGKRVSFLNKAFEYYQVPNDILKNSTNSKQIYGSIPKLADSWSLDPCRVF